MNRTADIERETKETHIRVSLKLDGQGQAEISSGIPFFDHMLTLFTVHGFFDLCLHAKGDLDVDFHHTVEDVGLVIGQAVAEALGDRKGIRRYGHAVTPMDDALAAVTVDLSNRPFLVYNAPQAVVSETGLSPSLAKEFFRALVNRAGMNLHINVPYGENEHHVIESIFKAFGRALDEASTFDVRIAGVRSSKGVL
ncbi:MAG: imidazoleglycerol-phosphate dehydratase HisB [Deltaproteobacteria bacterium]|jgi:imidazoleglycerol-phosphate dehydratase|nr:imidazoleglycerol-phosphate dehydratase HisB [Deltaproteobacteria bacterium]